MRVHFQRSIRFCLFPRLRFYRRLWLLWLRWLGKSAYIDGSQDWLCIRTEGRVLYRVTSQLSSQDQP